MAAGTLRAAQPPFAEVDASEQGTKMEDGSRVPLRQPDLEPSLGAGTSLDQLAAAVWAIASTWPVMPARDGGSSASSVSAWLAKPMARPISSRNR